MSCYIFHCIVLWFLSQLDSLTAIYLNVTKINYSEISVFSNCTLKIKKRKVFFFTLQLGDKVVLCYVNVSSGWLNKKSQLKLRSKIPLKEIRRKKIPPNKYEEKNLLKKQLISRSLKGEKLDGNFLFTGSTVDNIIIANRRFKND